MQPEPSISSSRWLSVRFCTVGLQTPFNNQFPNFTISNAGEVDELHYQIINKATKDLASLLVKDRMGGHYVGEAAPHPEVCQRLAAAHGLVVLIDPERGHNAIKKELIELFCLMQRDRPTSSPLETLPVAVCLSKADTLLEIPADFRQACKHPCDFVTNLAGWGWLPELIDYYCKNYRFFPVSSTGIELFHGILESNTFYDENFIPRVKSTSHSINLIRPFEWLMPQLGGAAIASSNMKS